MPKAMRIVREVGRPVLASVTRQGDPTGAVAAFVSTAGIGTRGAVVQTTLAGIFEARLGGGARATPQDGGVRVVISMSDARDVEHLAAALRASVTETDVASMKRKLGALAALPRVPDELAPIVACEGALVAPPDLSVPSAEEVETWRRAAVVDGRVAFGVVGAIPVEHAPALPNGSREARDPDEDSPTLATYDSGETRMRLAITWRGDLRLLGVARALGATRSPFEAMLAASDPGAHVRSVTAALSSHGVCLSLRADLDEGSSERAAALVALATKEARVAVLEEDGAADSPSNALEAAEQAAVIGFVSSEKPRFDAPHVVVGTATPTPEGHDALARAIETATHAWDSRVVEARTHVEAGQPAAWMLVGSPCGTAGESDGDAGASAAFAVAVARMVEDAGVLARPWITYDGIGVLASDRDAHKLADVLARSFIVDPVEGARASQGRLLEAVHPALAALAQAIAPGRPASMLPTGTSFGLSRLSDAAITTRAEALRLGPIRVAAIANVDAAQAAGMLASADRWIARTGARVCPAEATASTVKPGTYAVVTDDGSSEAYLAASVPEGAEGEVIAAALDGVGGLLEKSLGDGLARAYGARVLGPSGARAIVIHVEAPSSALDNAVAQTRALLDRLRQGALSDDDVARAKKREETSRAAFSNDPRERLIALFRGEATPRDVSLDQVRVMAKAALRDELLVIVAARPRTTGRTP
jgi:hypothetical protein